MKILSITLLFSLAAFSARSQQTSEVFKTDGKAIKGYDAVAFYTDAKPVPGDAKYTYSWKGADWLFASQAHLDSFKTAPDRYAPQYGGYCAFGTAGGHKAPTETDTWTIIDHKLYFNYNTKVKERWTKNTSQYIQKADSNWVKIKDTQ